MLNNKLATDVWKILVFVVLVDNFYFPLSAFFVLLATLCADCSTVDFCRRSNGCLIAVKPRLDDLSCSLCYRWVIWIDGVIRCWRELMSGEWGVWSREGSVYSSWNLPLSNTLWQQKIWMFQVDLRKNWTRLFPKKTVSSKRWDRQE